jgi:hypothetical protein
LSFPSIPEKRIVRTLDTLRRKRNTGAYDDYGLVSQGEADHAGKVAAEVRRQVEEWIKKNYADKI